MIEQEILSFLKSNAEFFISKILKQHWKESKYSYINLPRPDYGLMLVLKGSVTFVTEKEILTASAGNFVFLPKNSRYEAAFVNETDDYLVSFDSSTSSLLLDAPVKLMQNTPFSCVEIFSELISENYFETGSNLKIKGLFYMLLDSVANNTEYETNGHRRLVNRVCELLREHNERPMGEIAKECSVSESGLRSIFKQELGITPTQYRTSIKIRQAEYLLEATDMSVAEIAEQLGFFDAAYFCKVFKEQMGVTPKQYSQNKKI
ncbi:MAG: helix-turn-helix transcriptional regulator [Clostridia bacterium]|nr:helix-turn-helix transcriptional regulator [Clostridia bacterium]